MKSQNYKEICYLKRLLAQDRSFIWHTVSGIWGERHNNVRMNKIEDAEKAFAMASKIDPGNAVIRAYMKKINELKEKKQN